MINNYSIKKRFYQCQDCEQNFSTDEANDIDIVKFSEVDGTNFWWLPLIGEKSYFSLLQELIINFNPYKQEITMKIAKEFEKNLNTKYNFENKIIIGSGKILCPNCNSNDIKWTNDEILKSYHIKWLSLRKKELNL